jgi:hypothetical protein
VAHYGGRDGNTFAGLVRGRGDESAALKGKKTMKKSRPRSYQTIKVQTETFGQQTHEFWLPEDVTPQEFKAWAIEVGSVVVCWGETRRTMGMDIDQLLAERRALIKAAFEDQG